MIGASPTSASEMADSDNYTQDFRGQITNEIRQLMLRLARLSVETEGTPTIPVSVLHAVRLALRYGHVDKCTRYKLHDATEQKITITDYQVEKKGGIDDINELVDRIAPVLQMAETTKIPCINHLPILSKDALQDADLKKAKLEEIQRVLLYYVSIITPERQINIIGVDTDVLELAHSGKGRCRNLQVPRKLKERLEGYISTLKAQLDRIEAGQPLVAEERNEAEAPDPAVTFESLLKYLQSLTCKGQPRQHRTKDGFPANISGDTSPAGLGLATAVTDPVVATVTASAVSTTPITTLVPTVVPAAPASLAQAVEQCRENLQKLAVQCVVAMQRMEGITETQVETAGIGLPSQEQLRLALSEFLATNLRTLGTVAEVMNAIGSSPVPILQPLPSHLNGLDTTLPQVPPIPPTTSTTLPTAPALQQTASEQRGTEDLRSLFASGFFPTNHSTALPCPRQRSSTPIGGATDEYEAARKRARQEAGEGGDIGEGEGVDLGESQEEIYSHHHHHYHHHHTQN